MHAYLQLLLTMRLCYIILKISIMHNFHYSENAWKNISCRFVMNVIQNEIHLHIINAMLVRKFLRQSFLEEIMPLSCVNVDHSQRKQSNKTLSDKKCFAFRIHEVDIGWNDREIFKLGSNQHIKDTQHNRYLQMSYSDFFFLSLNEKISQ